MVAKKEVQEILKGAGLYHGAIDGVIGNMSKRAMSIYCDGYSFKYENSSDEERLVFVIQVACVKAGYNPGPIDGIYGPSTDYALDSLRNDDGLYFSRSHDINHDNQTSIPTYDQLRDFYGDPGSNLVKAILPYSMKLAWDTSVKIDSFTCHKLVKDDIEKGFQLTLDYYEIDEIRNLGLDLFGGCYNNRSMRGGKKLSTHAWAISIDMDPLHNKLRWGKDRARMAQEDYKPFLDIFEKELNWVSLGRKYGYDFMHLQKCQ